MGTTVHGHWGHRETVSQNQGGMRLLIPPLGMAVQACRCVWGEGELPSVQLEQRQPIFSLLQETAQRDEDVRV